MTDSIKPVAWHVGASMYWCNALWAHAREDAEMDAKRIGGTAKAEPIYDQSAIDAARVSNE